MTDQNCIINQTIQRVCGSVTTWYEGKMELEVVPRIAMELFENEGIRVDVDTIKQRIDRMNHLTLIPKDQRFILVTFSDNTRYKIPLSALESQVISDCLEGRGAILLDAWARKLAARGDLDYSEAKKQVVNSDHIDTGQLLTYAEIVQWKDVEALAQRVDLNHSVVNLTAEFPTANKRVVSGSDIQQMEIDEHVRSSRHVGGTL